MPKIRQKQYLKINSEYRKKSGILTRSIKNIIKKNISSKSFFKENTFHNSQQIEYNIIPYNDDNTHLFLEKLVNPVIPIEDNLKSKSSILHTPNEFDTTLKIQKLTNSRFYDKNLETQYLSETIDFHPYDDATIESKIDLIGNKEKININLEFDEPCKLSLNKNTLNSDGTTASDTGSYVDINNNSYAKQNSSIAYFNFEDKSWDYLGNINKGMYFDDEDTFETIPLAFNTISPENGKAKVKNQVLGIPINTFGFPFDSRYQAMDRHLLKMKNFILKPFVLEKIKISFIGTNLSECEQSLAHSVINSLNFFILNQRKNLNENSFENLKLDKGIYEQFNGTFVSGSTIDYNINETPIYAKTILTGTPGESTSTFIGSESNLTLQELQSSQRELVSYLSLVNFSSGSNNTENIDYEKIKENADLFYEELQSPNEGFSAQCIYDKKTLEIEGDVRTPVYYEALEPVSHFRIYPFSKFANRTGTEYNSERSIKSDFTKSVNIETSLDYQGRSLSIGNNFYKSNPYTIHPKDELVVGFSFNPSMIFFDNSNYSKDIYMIFEKVKITLIGSYYNKNSSKKINYNNYNLINFKRVDYYDNKNTCDKIGFNNIYLNKGAFYDSALKIVHNKTPSGETGEIYENFYSSAGNDNINVKRLFYASNTGTFTSYSIENINNEIVLIEDRNNLEEIYVTLEKFSAGLLSNRKYSTNAKLTEDKKYIFDVSSATLTGCDIKLSLYNSLEDASAYTGEGISYIGTPGTKNEDPNSPDFGPARIVVEPRKIDASDELLLFFVNLNENDAFALNFNGIPNSILIIKNSMTKNKSAYRYRSFGQPFDKLYEYRFLPYNDIDDNNKVFYTIQKRFKTVFLEEIETPTLSYNVDQYSRISVPSPFLDSLS